MNTAKTPEANPAITPRAWAYQFAAESLEEALDFWVPAHATKAQVQAARRLLKRLKELGP